MFGKAVRTAILISLGCALGYGQTQQSTVPQHLGAEAPPLTMQLDPEYKNVIVGGVFMGGAWDDKGLAHGTTPLSYSSDARYFLQPSLAFQQTLSTVNWTVAYTPGASVSQHQMDNFQYTQNAAGDFLWTPNVRFSLHLRQDYSVSDNPFEHVGRVPILPELNGFFGPNDMAVVPNQQRTSFISNADVSYRLTKRAAIGATGGYQRYDYSNLPSLYGMAGAMLPSHTYTGSLFYSQQITKGHTIGIQYAVMDYHTDNPVITSFLPSRVQTHTALLFETWKMGPHATLTLYGGPQYSRSTLLLTQGSHESIDPAGGLTFNWIGERSAFQVSGVRRVSDGGGLMTSVVLTDGTAGFRRRMSRRWMADARLSVTDQKALQLFINEGNFRTWWGGVGISRDITDRLSVRVEYARVRQTGFGSINNILHPGNHNLVQFALNWHFRKPLGR
jgi:hypothetical protein